MLNPQGYVTLPPALGKTDTGGQVVYLLELSQALARERVKVDIITRQFAGQPAEEQPAENLRIVRIPAGGDDFIPKEKLFEIIPEFVENLKDRMRRKRRKYDIVHSHYWDGGYAGSILSKEIGVPHVNTPHSLGKLKEFAMSVEDLPPQKLKPAYRYHVRNAIEQKILEEADATIVINETSRIQVLQHYKVDFEKLHVIYPGIDTSKFRVKPNRYDQQVSLDKNSILTMSRMVPAKGLDRVLDAVARLHGKVKFNLYMGGSAHDEFQSEEEQVTERELLKLIKRHKLDSSVHFVGDVPHHSLLPAYYRAADVFVLAGRFEQFGLTTLEAMACGTVPVVSSVAGSREVIIDGLNGFIVDTHNRQELADCLSRLLRKPELRQKISENAVMSIQDHYSWGKIVKQILKLYGSVARRA